MNQITQYAQEFIDALHSLEEAGDFDAEPVAILFSEDATLTNSVLELHGREVQGRDAILQFWTDYNNTLGKVRSKFHHITTGERTAGLFWTTEGAEENGQPVRYHGATLLEFNERGLISFFRGYYDTRELTVKQPVEAG